MRQTEGKRRVKIKNAYCMNAKRLCTLFRWQSALYFSGSHENDTPIQTTSHTLATYIALFFPCCCCVKTIDLNDLPQINDKHNTRDNKNILNVCNTEKRPVTDRYWI